MKNDAIAKAIHILNNGGVIIFPTDTVYGIGCRIDRESAVKRVFSIRNRPEEKAVLALVDSINMAQVYLEPIPEKVRTNLMDIYWPGNLTIILPCLTDKIPGIVRANGRTLGVRQTSHPILLKILKEIKVPLIAPSANFSGEKTPVFFNDLDLRLISLVDFILPGDNLSGEPSTIIDCSINPWKIVRSGAVKINLKSII